MPEWLPPEIVTNAPATLVLLALLADRLFASRAQRARVDQIADALLKAPAEGEGSILDKLRDMHRWLGAREDDGTLVSRIRLQHSEALATLSRVAERQTALLEAMNEQMRTLQAEVSAVLERLRRGPERLK